MSAYRDAVNAFRRDLLATTLAAHGDNRQRTADALGMDRNALRVLLRKHGVAGHGTPGRPRKTAPFVASDPRAPGSVSGADVSAGGRGEDVHGRRAVHGT